MSGLGFLNPLLLGGLALASLPLLIHLLQKRRLPEQVLPTLRFLQQVNQQVKRRIRLRDVLLLAMRTLAIILLVLLVARPVWHDDADAIADAGPSAHSFIYVVDASFGMKYRKDGTPLFEHARDRVVQEANRLQPGQEAAVVLCDDQWQLLTNGFEGSGAVGRALRQAAPGDFAVDWENCLRDSLTLASRSQHTSVEIRLFTNLTARSWERASLPRASDERPVRVRLIDVAGMDLPNRAITGIDLAQSYGMGGAQWQATVEASNFGPPADNIGLRLLDAEERSIGQALFDWDEPGVRERSIDLEPTQEETISGMAELEGDALPEDDIMPFRFYFGRLLQVLIVDGSPGGYAGEADSHYVTTALRPGRSSTMVEPRVLTRTSLRADDLDQADVVFLLNTGSLSTETTGLLDQFVQNGGGLFWAMGDHMDADAFESAGPLIPGRLRTMRDLRRPGHDPVSLKSYPSEHPIFRDIHVGNLATARFHAYAQLEGLPEDTRMLLEFSDGSPALVSRRHGDGRILWFASTLNAAWNNFPFRPYYLPLLQQSVRYLADSLQSPLQREYPVGSAVALTAPGGEQGLVVEGPGGVRTEVDTANGEATFSGTRSAGVYRVHTVEGRHLPDADFLMRRDPMVSDLRRMEPDEITARLEAANFGAEMDREPGATTRFDPMMLLLALMGMTLMAEALVARRGLR